MNIEAASIVEASDYMTLATADAQGIPWATPVWFAPDGDRALLWLSDPETRHSRNLHEQPRLSIVIFDSRVPSSEATAVYFEAVAEQVEDDIEAFSAYSVIHGRGEWTAAEVTAPSHLRLYRANLTERWLLPAGARNRVAY